jgi:hypothetical protein
MLFVMGIIIPNDSCPPYERKVSRIKCRKTYYRYPVIKRAKKKMSLTP